MITTSELHDLFLQFPAITTDSRKIPAGSLFFALKGENFDGNAFAMQALEKGAAKAIVDDARLQGQPGCIVVGDVLNALQELAKFHRLQFKIPVIAITGTNGKTTTKELTREVLSQKYNTLSTPGNLNNHIGVPLTLLNINKETEIAIIEMGANHQGEIDQLSRIACPTHGLITNVGKAHLEGFGGFEGVIKTKTELYHYLKEQGGSIFINGDNPLLISHAVGIKQVSYGSDAENFLSGKVIPETSFVELQTFSAIGNMHIRSKLFGSYNAENILATACIGQFFDVPSEKIISAIESYFPQNNRSQFTKTSRNTLILDAYNANPTSMEQAIQHFAASPFSEKCVILGDMLELGEESDSEHFQLLQLVKLQNFKSVTLVGPVFTRLCATREWHCFQDSDLARLWFEHHKPKGETFLIKGSRGIKLEKIVGVL
ncbi:MAG: UDP-N-acetylmuramoyl-tripeptide--D-alanyl-D-alanine ligase [Bacteroidota bacterium]